MVWVKAVSGAHPFSVFGAASAVGSDSNLGGLMLNYFRETQEARFATRARRIYGYVSVGFVVAVGVLVIAGLAPVWTSWTILGVSCVLDAFLARKWIREDALRAYRSDRAG